VNYTSVEFLTGVYKRSRIEKA